MSTKILGLQMVSKRLRMIMTFIKLRSVYFRAISNPWPSIQQLVVNVVIGLNNLIQELLDNDLL